MTKRKRRQFAEAAECKLDMTSMIDVTFLLLIFFMLTIKFKILEGKLAAYLPKDVGVNIDEAEPKEKTDIRIRVINEGTKVDPRDLTKAWKGVGAFQYGLDRVVQYAVGPHKTKSLDSLSSRLKDLFEADPEEAAATIDPDTATVYEDVIEVLDIAIIAGFTDITFKGAPPPSTKSGS